MSCVLGWGGSDGFCVRQQHAVNTWAQQLEVVNALCGSLSWTQWGAGGSLIPGVHPELPEREGSELMALVFGNLWSLLSEEQHARGDSCP